MNKIILGLLLILNFNKSVISQNTNNIINCTSDDNCNNNGVCNKNTCICNIGYTTYNSITKCNYKQKDQLIAFFLSLLLGIFGADQLYMGNYIIAIPKISITIVTICIFCSYKIDNNEIKEKTSCSLYLFSLIVFAWYISDVVMIGLNNYTDGNEILLKSWDNIN